MSRLILTLSALCLCGYAGSARAGDGGSDAGTIQSFLNQICQTFGYTVPATPPDPSIPFNCPQLPTITQGTLEIAGLGYARPEAIRRSQNIAPGSVFASNSPPIPDDPVVPITLPITPTDFANLKLTPLAFASPLFGPVSKAKAFAPVKQLFDPTANSFLSGVTTFDNVNGHSQPHVLNLFYEDLFRNINFFLSGQEVAKFSIPLVVYDSSTCKFSSTGDLTGCAETEVMTILDVRAACTGGANCLKAYAIADFSGFGTQRCSSLMAAQKCTAEDLGIHFSLVFGGSPTSSIPHAIFEVQVPLVVTLANDLLHFNELFNSPQSMLSIPNTPTFAQEDFGSIPLAFLSNKTVGLATYPAPVCHPGPLCPDPTSAFQSNFGFCASLPDNLGILRPAVAAFLGIATDGEVLASAPLGASTSPTLQCPF